MGGARPFFVEGQRPAARPARHDLPAARRGSRPAPRGRGGAVRRQGDRPAPGDHLRHRLHPGVPRVPLHRVRMGSRRSPRGPGAHRAAPPGPGRRHDRRRGRRARRRAPGRPAAPAPDPALAALGPRQRPQDHRSRPRRGAVRRGRGQPRGRGHHGAGPDALRPADRVLARRRGHRPAATALPPAPRHKGRVCTPRQVRAGVPAILDAITYRALRGQAADAPLRAQTPAGLAMALRMVQRPSYQLDRGRGRPAGPGPPAARAARPDRLRHRITLLRPAV